MKPKVKLKTGLLGKSPKDERDYLLTSIQPLEAALPDIYILRDKQSPVQTQESLGICYAMASAGIAEYWNGIEYNQFINLSERFVAHYTKTLSGMWDKQGDYFRYAVKAICDYGVCLETDWQNDFSLSWEDFIKTEPPEDIKKKAEEFKGKTYWRVDGNLESIKQAIYQNNTPILIGMGWFSSYNATPLDGKLPMPSGTQSGHAIMCVGWENNKLWFKNSWGSNWGSQGYFYIPFDDFDKHDIWEGWILLDLPKQNMRLKLIREKGRKEVYWVLNGKPRWIGSIDIFNDLVSDGLAKWEDVQEVDEIIENRGVLM